MTLSVLMIDDNKEKYKLVNDRLIDCGISEELITYCESINSGRAYLRKNQYDLLIIDIALPERDGGAPVQDGGVRLLDEMMRRGYNKPHHIVGITGFEDIKRDHDSFFSEHLWYLIKTTGVDGAWLNHLCLFVEYVFDAKQQPVNNDYEVDVFVVAALRTTELSAIKDIDLGWSNSLPLDHASFYMKGSFLSNENKYSICAGSPPKVGMVHTALYVQKIIHKIKPRYIVMTGICAGVRGDCAMGDIIVANPAWGWQSGKYDEKEKHFKIEPDQITIPDYIAERFNSLADDKEYFTNIWSKWRGNKPATPPNLLLGAVASGSSVLADSDVVDSIKKQHRKVLGIEMEIYGLYASASYASQPKPSFFALKSVCDHGDGEKDDDYQDYAAYLSACALLRFLEVNYSEISGFAGMA